MDEMVRNHKHWHCMRLKFKPNVHSGSLFDAICDCRTYYCVAGGEQNTDLSRDSSLAARVERLCRAANMVGKWHILDLDRGYSSVDVATKCREMQVHYNLNMPWNRVAIPRNAMVDAAKLCEAGTGWEWTCFHKGVNEMQVWNDGATVFFITDCMFGRDVTALKRSTKGAKACYVVSVPPGSGAFNVYGRSGCDSSDQSRK